jgi:hypothetical protein
MKKMITLALGFAIAALSQNVFAEAGKAHTGAAPSSIQTVYIPAAKAKTRTSLRDRVEERREAKKIQYADVKVPAYTEIQSPYYPNIERRVDLTKKHSPFVEINGQTYLRPTPIRDTIKGTVRNALDDYRASRWTRAYGYDPKVFGYQPPTPAADTGKALPTAQPKTEVKAKQQKQQ